MTLRTRASVLRVPIDALDWDDVLSKLLRWGAARESRYVAVCNVHVVVTASRDEHYRRIIAEADLAVPDGAPIAWTLRRCGFPGQMRISGPDLMWRLCAECATATVAVFLLGGSESVLRTLRSRLEVAFPALTIAGMHAPPFTAPTAAEDEEIVQLINRSGAGVVFVALGCPKQERWMAEHRGRIESVMVGVGAAFDFHARTLKRAPQWMQNRGLEWLHRLAMEPRRLWKRYLVTNSLFILATARDMLARMQGRGTRK